MKAFWEKVDRSGECWLWTGAKSAGGYGQLRIAGKTLYAHRLVLEMNGVDVSGRSVDHRCSTRACVRPEHLRLVTAKQNNEHRVAANKNSASGIRGVFYCNTFHKWFGSVTHLRRQYRKSFATREEAAEWVVAKRNELFSHNDHDRLSA